MWVASGLFEPKYHEETSNKAQKSGLNHSLRLHRFCAVRIRCLLKGGQEVVDILVGEFLGLIPELACFADAVGYIMHTLRPVPRGCRGRSEASACLWNEA